jgi:hypothetical protein
MSIQDGKLIARSDGIYHSATVCCPDAISVKNFEYMAAKSIIWTYVPNIWLKEGRSGFPPDPGIHFPLELVTDLSYDTTNCLSFIRIVPRSRRKDGSPVAAEPFYSMKRIRVS